MGEQRAWHQLTAEVVYDVSQWPDAPFLFVERRSEDRRGKPWCFLYARGDHAYPVVYMSAEWPPEPGFERTALPQFAYDNMHDLFHDGWTPYSVEPPQASTS